MNDNEDKKGESKLVQFVLSTLAGASGALIEDFVKAIIHAFLK